jgi:Arc/MetJ family transcription regulator
MTQVAIDDTLVQEAIQFSEKRSEQEVVERALQNFVFEMKQQQEALQYFGKLKWEGDLNEMRCDK